MAIILMSFTQICRVFDPRCIDGRTGPSSDGAIEVQAQCLLSRKWQKMKYIAEVCGSGILNRSYEWNFKMRSLAAAPQITGSVFVIMLR